MADFIPPIVVDIISRSTGFKAGVDKAKGDMSGLSSAAEKDTQKVSAASQDMESDVKAHTSKAGAAFKGMGTALGAATLGAGVAIGAAAYEGVKSAAGFQTAMTQLVTGAGEAEKNIGLVSSGIQAMAPTVAQTPAQLAKGMYLIESAGYHGAAGLTVLQSAAEGAATGGAQMSDVANVLTTAMHDYAIPASRSNAVTSALIQTVALGKTHLGDLSTAMASVMPVASSMGVSFQNVTGAMSTMTVAGMTAHRAGTNLAFMLRAFGAPGKAGVAALQSVHLSAQKLKDTMSKQGLPAALALVTDAIGKTFPKGSVAATGALKDITGGAAGLNTALMLSGKNAGTFAANSKQIGTVLDGSAKSVQGFGKASGDLGFQFDALKAQMSASLISIGTAIMPAISKVMPAISKALAAIMGAVGPALKAIMPAITSVIGEIGPALKAVMPAITSVIKTVAPIFSNLVKEVLPIVAPLLKIFGPLIAQIGKAFAPVLAAIGPILKSLIPALAPLLKLFGSLATEFGGVAAAVLKDFGPTIALLAGSLGKVFGQLQKSGAIAALGKMFEKIAPPLASLVSQLISGLMPIIEDLIPALAPIIGLVGGLAAGLLKLGPVKDVILAVVGAMIAWKVITTIMAAAQAALDIVMDANPLGLIVLAIIAVVAAVTEVVKHFGFFEHIAKEVWGAIKSVITGAVHAVSHVISSVFGAIVKTLAGIWHAIEHGVSAAWDAIKHAVASAVDAVGHLIGSIAGKIAGAVSGVFDAAVKFGAKILHGIINGIGDLVSTVAGFIANIATGLWHAAESAFTAAVHFGEHIVTGIGHALIALPGVVLHAIESIPVIGKAIKVALSVGKSVVGQALGAVGLAQGAVVAKPTLAMIGEGSEPEAVLPLSQLRKMLTGAPGEFYPAQGAGGGAQAKGGLTVGSVVINGTNQTNAQIVNDLYLRLRPLLTAPAY